MGEDSPNKLRDTVLFLLGINCLLRAVEEHYSLRRNFPGKPSQLSFQTNEFGDKCIVYTEDTVTKTHDGGLADMRHERKVCWIFPNKTNIIRCPVRLIEKYMSLCPVNYTKKDNFYLQALQKPTPKQWYGSQVVGSHTLSKVIKNLMKDAEIEGYFTNHSARRTGGTRLFQAGVDRKIVKECTGHSSDAVDKYQVTSHAQRREVSNILQSDPTIENCNNVTSAPVDSKPTDSSTVKVSVNDSQNVGDMINKLISGNQGKGVTKIKIEIEITHQ